MNLSTPSLSPNLMSGMCVEGLLRENTLFGL